MNNVVLTLPDPIYQKLVGMAQTEGLSLNQYVLNAMAAHVVMDYRARATTATERQQQRAEYVALLDRLGTTTDDEIERILAEREPVAPELEMSAETQTKFRALIAERQQSRA